MLSYTSMVRGPVVGLGVTLLILVAGCGSPSNKPTNVSGKVTYKGQTLNHGTVVFHGPNGKKAAAAIGADGSFQMADAPIGEIAVAVNVPPVVKPPPGASMPGSDINPVLIPPHFADPVRSGVKNTITAGTSTITVDLK